MTLSQTQSEFEQRITEGQKLVHALASRIHGTLPPCVELDELISYGQLGLTEAARSFDPAKGTQFSTFAWYRIRGAIYDGVGKMAWLERHESRHARRRRLEDDVLSSEAMGDAHSSQRSESLCEQAAGLSGVIERMAVVRLTTLAAAGEFSDDDVMCDSRAASPSETAELHELVEHLRGLLNDLPELERDLIRQVYFEGRTLADVAAAHGKSKSWSTRLHQRTLEILAQRLRRIGAD